MFGAFDKLSQFIDAIQSIPGNITGFFTDPIWALIWMVAGVIGLAVLLRIFFPAQSPLWGAAVVAAIAHLWGYVKGRREKRRR